jgi:hypothetical protein
MHARGLKTSLLFNLFLALAGAMLLIDLVMIFAVRRAQLHERLSTGQTLLLSALALSGEDGSHQPLSSTWLDELLRSADGLCLGEIDASGRPSAEYGTGCREAETRLREAAIDAMRTGGQTAAISGGWPGLFWPGGSKLIVSRPFPDHWPWNFPWLRCSMSWSTPSASFWSTS